MRESAGREAECGAIEGMVSLPRISRSLPLGAPKARPEGSIRATLAHGGHAPTRSPSMRVRAIMLVPPGTITVTINSPL